MNRLLTSIFQLFTLLFCLCYSSLLWAQQPILIDTLTLNQKKALEDKYTNQKKTFYAELDKKYGSKEVKEIKTIFDQSYTDIQKSIQKNELIEESPFNTYLNELVLQIRAKNPEIPKNLVILASREYETNASSRGEGTIVVNQYLLETLDNEDQLIFILCHEIAHQKLDHVLQSIHEYVKLNTSAEMKGKTKQLKKQKFSKKTSASELLTELKYKNSEASRTHEVQADSLGYIYYSKLGRSPQQVVKTLKNLKDSDKEKDSLSIKDYKTIFASFSLPTKDKWFEMENFDLYSYQENNKFNTDSLRTHPNCDVRIEMLVKIDSTIQKNGVQKTMSANTEFKKWKENVIYQNIANEYLMQHYGNSLYEALKQYKRTPNAYLRKWISENFKKLYDAKKAYQLNRYVSQVNINQYTTSYNLFSTFVFNLSLAELLEINQKLNQ